VRFKPAALLAAMGLAIVVVVALSPGAEGTRSLNSLEPPNGDVYLGVSEPGGLANLQAFDAAAGISQPAIYNKYVAADGPLGPSLGDGSIVPGATMMLSWDVTFSGGRVTSGADNSYLAAQVAAVRAYAKPVFLRLDWEMNAPWYRNYSLPAVTPAEYIASWRYIVNAFAGVPDAVFVWAPNVNDRAIDGVTDPAADWYPGDDFVNWVGLDAYEQYTSVQLLLDGPDGMNPMAAFALVHGKPLMLSEWSPNLPNPDTAAAIFVVFNWASSWPDTVKALVYFDYDVSSGDHTLVDHPVGAAEFRLLTKDNPHYLTSVVPTAAPPSPTSTTTGS
jgi:hypothetical protein